MSDLVEFLTARLDEDERIAKAAYPGRWETATDYEPDAVYRLDMGDVPGLLDDPAVAVLRRRGPLEYGSMTHIARHDPARVLAEVAAKRRIIDRCWTYTGPHFLAADDVLKLLALPYAKHPDYDKDWAG